jgi:hypothetical protein
MPSSVQKATAAGGSFANNRLISTWSAGGMPGAGATPPSFTAGAGYTCGSATAGAIPFVFPTGQQLYLVGWQTCGTSAQRQSFFLYDRLWHCRDFSANTASTQTITTPGVIPARDANGSADGFLVDAFLEVYTAVGATSADVTLSYTNSDGVGSRSAIASALASGTSAVGSMIPFALQAGDVGIKAVSSIALSAPTGSVGNIGVTLARRVAEVSVECTNDAIFFDVLRLGKPRIYPDSCLYLVGRVNSTSAGAIVHTLYFARD